MAAGDVDVQIVDADTTLIDTAVTGMRHTANDKWLIASVSNGLQVIVVNVEEA